MPTYQNSTNKDITLPYSFSTQTHKTIVSAGDTIETSLYLTDAEITALGLTKTLETPYARLSNSLTQVEFTGAETKSVTNLLDSPIIRVKTNVNITIKPNASANSYGYHLGSNEGFIDIRNNREILTLYLTSDDAGIAYVMELLN
jgi:hypothetical protein